MSKGYQFTAHDNPRHRGVGRKKGVPNKLTATFKEALLSAFDPEAFVKWAKANPTEYYKIMAKLIPTEIVGTGEDGEHVVRIIHDAR